jgi:AcrR family transcriptional regulator
MTTRSTPQHKLLAAATAEIIANGWAGFSLTKAARKATIPLATLYEICPGKGALLSLLGKEIDLAFLRHDHEIDPQMAPRDRAFDAMLCWFEHLEPHRPLLQAIREAGASDPGLIVDLLPLVARSAHWIAEVAHLPDTGWRGFAITRGMGLLMADTVPVWLDDTRDLARTMAHLDRRLRMIEEWSETLEGLRRDADPDNESDRDPDRTA